MDFLSDHVSRLLAGPTGLDASEVRALLGPPPRPELGDVAFPCFALAKALRKAPAAIAADLAGQLTPPDGVAEIRAEGPYVNFFVDAAALARAVLPRAWSEAERYGGSDVGAGRTVVIDFSSPNIAKPFGVGHLRSTNIGAALGRIHRFLGHPVVGINHLGDWGTQFGCMVTAYRRWGDAARLAAEGVPYLTELYIRFHREAEENPALAEEARSAFRALEAGDEEVTALWRGFRETSLAEFQRVYDLLGVEFEAVTGESFYNDRMEAVIERLRERGIASVSDGALVVDLSADDMPPCLLRKADGATLYATRDLAGIYYRRETYDFDRLLYVVGAEQKLHFRQVFRVLELAGEPWADRCAHVPFGLFRFGGRKMATREGHVVLLEDLLRKAIDLARQSLAGRDLPEEEKESIAASVGIGAVLFADLKARRHKDCDFAWERVLQYDPETGAFKGETGPYLQYMHARVCSLLRRAGRAADPADADLSLVAGADEKPLLKAIEAFPAVLRRAAAEDEPSYVSEHLISTAALFSSYYGDRERHQVVSEDAALTSARLLLCVGVQCVLANGLRLLGIRPLEQM